MKIIHTADWHLGQTLRQYDRTEEHQHFFNQLVELVTAEQPDALLVCGDVFHNSTPSNATTKLYTQNMVRLHEACTSMAIVVIAGNHDSCSRLESTDDVWKLANVTIVGGLEHTDEGYNLDKHIIRIGDKGFVIAIPDINERYNDVFGLTQQRVAELNTTNLPVVMMGHLSVMGCDTMGHKLDHATEVGGKVIINSNEIVTPVCDYVALGHIHRPQTLNTAVTTRYSGSVLHVSFDERYPHTVSVVSIDKHGEKPSIREVRINQKKHCYIVPDTPLPVDEALEQLRKFNPSEPGYIRLDIKIKNYPPNDLNERVAQLMENKPNLDLFFINSVHEHSEDLDPQYLSLNTDDIKQASPDDVFTVAMNYCNEKGNIELDDQQKDLLKQVIEEVMREYSNSSSD